MLHTLLAAPCHTRAQLFITKAAAALFVNYSSKPHGDLNIDNHYDKPQFGAYCVGKFCCLNDNFGIESFVYFMKISLFKKKPTAVTLNKFIFFSSFEK